MRRRSNADPNRSAAGRGSAPLRVAALVLLAVAVLVACGPPETEESALRTPGGEPLYRDGSYAAAFSHTGPDGWRPFMLVRVRAGLIERVCFDAVNAEGVRVLDHEAYLERYRLETGLRLAELVEELRAELLEQQRVPLHARTDPAESRPNADPWAIAFDQLAGRTLAAAEVGLTMDAAGIDVIPTAGPYRASDEPDELGWRAELVLVYDGDGVSAAVYREVRRELDGSERAKRDDEVYQERFEAARGVTTAGAADALIGQLLAGETSGLDAVTGATLLSARFIALLNRIESSRVEAPLPNRLCR